MYATVTDSDKRLVTDLVEEDFEIYDNGKLQTITSFDNKPLPITVVVMLDTSGSMTVALDLVKAAAEEFLMRLLPEDQGMVGAFNDKIQFIPDGEFTSSRDVLIRALKDLDFGYPTRLYDAVNQSMAQLKGIPGRKVVLVFTDGDDNASKVGSGEVTDRARVEETMIYSVGLETVYHNGQQQRAIVARPRAEEALGRDRRRVLSLEEDGRAGPDLHARRAGAAQPVCARLHPAAPRRQDPQARAENQAKAVNDRASA